MATIKKTMFVCLTLLVGMTLLGCGAMQQVVDSSDPESDQLLESFLDALLAGDADAAFMLMLPEHMERADFDASWATLLADWGKSPGYTYQKMRVNISISTNGKKVDNVYIVSREGEPDYIASLSRAETGGRSGISYFSVEIFLVSFE